MKSISKTYINLGVLFIILSVLSLVIGIMRWPFLILSAIFLLSYIYLDKKRLRCPKCGGFENLERLSYAKKHKYHCRHCGEKINISKQLNI